MTGPIVTTTDLDSYQSGDPQTVLDQATALVRAYCGWHVAPSVTETITVDGSGSSLQLLPSLYITDIASVTVDAVLVEGYTWSQAGYMRKAGCWPCEQVTVTLTHGHASVPDVQAVVLGLASRAQKSPDGVTRTQVGAISESYSLTGVGTAGGVTLVESDRAVLDRYRIPARP